MRRLVVVVLAAVVVLVAGPALAQVRDPFDPLVGPGGQEQPVGPAEQPEEAPGGPGPEGVTDRFAETGAEPQPWLVLAYGLIAIGAGVLLIPTRAT